MRFVPAGLEGAFIVEPSGDGDERGLFMRTWCKEEFASHGLNAELAQCSISFNRKKGTLRGMHWQKAPFEEDKLVRCTMGAVYDVIVDLRPGSRTFLKWASAELTAKNRLALYIPAGVAHGFMTLADGTELLYQISEFYHPECAAGVRWDDPAFSIRWPGPVKVVSKRDENYGDFPVEDIKDV